MHMHVRSSAIAFVWTAVVVASAAQPANAQPTDQTGTEQKAAVLSVTPFFALGDDLAPGAGGALSFVWTRSLTVEVEASLGTDAARSSAGLLYILPGLREFVYVAGGLGVQRDEFEAAAQGIGFVIQKKTEFAVNIGAGVILPIRDGWSYRSDFRWYNPDDEWPESWRVFSGIRFGLRR
jgi:hypothetical protein